MKRDCLKVSAVSFSKYQSSLFCCNFFLFSHHSHYRNHYYCFSYSLIISLTLFSIHFFMMAYWVLLLYYFLNLFSFLFIPYFKFIFVPFFFIYFLFCHFFALQMSPSCHYFQFYPHWPFKNPPTRTPRPFELSAKLKTHCLCYYIIIKSWAGQFNFTLYFSPANPILIYGPSFPEPLEVYDTHTFLVKFQCTFHLNRSSSHHPRQQDN